MPAAAASAVVVISMQHSLHSANATSRANVCRPQDDAAFPVAYDGSMTECDRNYLRQWREYRGLSQDDLAAAINTTKSVVSLLENEKRPLSSKWLRRIADALNTRPGYILDHDPNEVEADIFDLWSRMSDTERGQAANILRALRTGTDN